ncbi:Hypothetical protein POVR1_LOCUS479 [uncultured virus]|nr:Hypothetical protein POVR1_LOCUS479 [uncultured virus]
MTRLPPNEEETRKLLSLDLDYKDDSEKIPELHQMTYQERLTWMTKQSLGDKLFRSYRRLPHQDLADKLNDFSVPFIPCFGSIEIAMFLALLIETDEFEIAIPIGLNNYVQAARWYMIEKGTYQQLEEINYES